ncbi:MAG: potassium channel protein [Spirochaetaceae bacterium]|nr:MAG: potassium channel protein [Spirochaetaceae bacterium]
MLDFTSMGRFSTLLRFLTAFFLLVLLIVIGTLGYAFIEGWSIGDSLYMTFITITTVGFGEVRPLSAAGQHFTIIFLVLSIGTVGYSVTVLITYVFEGQILNVMRERRMKRAIRHLKEHFIIVGGGNVGREAAFEFKKSKKRFVIVDRNPTQSDLSRDESIPFVEGDAINDEVLMEAGVQRASGLIASLPDDEANVFVVLTARQLNPHLLIVSQAAEERSIRKLIKAGANRVISPKKIAGQRMAAMVLRPNLLNFLDVIVQGGELDMRIEEIRLDSGSPLIEKTLREAGIGQHTGAIIVGINAPEGRVRINPSTTSTLSAVKLGEGDVLIALGNEDQLKRLQEFVRRGR